MTNRNLKCFNLNNNKKKRTTNHGIDSLSVIESGVPFDDPLYGLIDSLFVASPGIIQPDEARLHVLNSPNHQQILIGLIGLLKLLNECIEKKVLQKNFGIFLRYDAISDDFEDPNSKTRAKKDRVEL